MITIFTPTYNRKDTLKDLYISLKHQDYNDFEWLIVDDGSTDGTKEYITQLKEENIINITYIKQENQGKSMAHNKGVENAKGEIFICIDSDDFLVDNVLLMITNQFEKIKENKEIAGLGFLRYYKDSEDIIGTKFPQDDMIENYYNIYHKHKVTGDKLFVFKTNILKNYLFPKFNNEKFVPEALIYNRIAKSYKLLLINKAAAYTTYLESGYSANYFELVKKNPNGNMLYYKELYEYEPTLYNVAAFNMYGMFAKKKFKEIIKEHPSTFKSVLMYIPALVKYLKRR